MKIKMKLDDLLFYFIFGGIPIAVFNTVFVWAKLPAWVNVILVIIGALFILFTIFVSVVAYDLTFMFLQGLFWTDIIYCIYKGWVCTYDNQQGCLIVVLVSAILFNLLLPFIFQKKSYERIESDYTKLKENFELVKKYSNSLKESYDKMSSDYTCAITAYKDIESKHNEAIILLREFEADKRKREQIKNGLTEFLRKR